MARLLSSCTMLARRLVVAPDFAYLSTPPPPPHARPEIGRFDIYVSARILVSASKQARVAQLPSENPSSARKLACARCQENRCNVYTLINRNVRLKNIEGCFDTVLITFGKNSRIVRLLVGEKLVDRKIVDRKIVDRKIIMD